MRALLEAAGLEAETVRAGVSRRRSIDDDTFHVLAVRSDPMRVAAVVRGPRAQPRAGGTRSARASCDALREGRTELDSTSSSTTRRAPEAATPAT